MKTSVVLLALATAALAAPALHEETFGDVHIPAKFLDAFTRERKSTLESSSSSSLVNLPTSQISEFGVSGRSFNLKKPIIIKKKVGSSYQVYRDSDEEKRDSSEPCRKQVRVDLCDEHNIVKPADMMKSSTNEDLNIHTTDDDMKHSIMLAKEAVENLQLLKSAPWKNGDSVNDAELHQDIEVARQALEHIHNNFALEAHDAHDTTLKEAEVVEDVKFPLAQTEEERLSQWKDAIENIQRNVELVRNIEESFKTTDNMPHTDGISTIKDIHKHENQFVRDTEDVEHKPMIKNLEHTKLEKSSEHTGINTDLVEKDMIESASMVSTSELQNLDHDDKAKLTSELQANDEHIVKAKDALEKLHDDKLAVDTMKLDHLPQGMETMALKVAEEAKEITETEKTEKLEKSADEHDKHIDETEAKMIEMKAAEHITDKQNKFIKPEDKTHEENHALEQLKQAGDFEPEIKTHENLVHHSLVEGKTALNENSMVPTMTSESLAIDQHKPMLGHTFDIKSAEDMHNLQHEVIDHFHMRWAQDKQFNSDIGMMKSVAAEPQVMDQTKHMHTVHHHTHQHPHHLDASSHAHLRQHEHFMTHGKSADMDAMQSNYYMNMRGAENMGQDGQRFKWRPSHTHQHESARSAYGVPAPVSAPASGAVGLFPNANVGSCGIPLLLSCNPSVVSGSLAKAHPASYSAPAYRTEDDFNFHTKRDVKKTENLVNMLKRAPTNSILKASSG